MKTSRASPKQKILLRGLGFLNEWIMSRIVSFVETEHAALPSSSVGNISIYVTGQNYIHVKFIQRRLDPYFLCFLALIIHWIRARYKENWDLTKLGQIKIPVWSGIECGFRGNCSSVRTYLSFQFQMQWVRKKENMRIRNEWRICLFALTSKLL